MGEVQRIRASAVAEMLAVSVRKVQQMAFGGRLPGAMRIDRTWTFDTAKMRAFAWQMNHEGRRRAALTEAETMTESLATIMSRAIPWPDTSCGVYFLIVGGVVMYVGQAVNVAARIAQHAAARKFDAWSWVPVERGQLNAVERAYIDALLPEWNQDHTTRRLRLSVPMEAPDA